MGNITWPIKSELLSQVVREIAHIKPNGQANANGLNFKYPQ